MSVVAPTTVVPPMVPVIPREIREAPIVHAISITEFLVVVAEPFGCPTCCTARAFFVLEKADMVAPWTYRCSTCAAGLS